jgi:hypothetical protein
MFHKRVYANDRLWLEGSFGTRLRRLLYIWDTGYYRHAESICKARIGLWLLWISTHPSPVTAAVALLDYATYNHLCFV